LSPFHYSKLISAIVSAVMLVGLPAVITATQARAESICHPEAGVAGSHWRQTRTAKRGNCSVRAGRKASAGGSAAFQAARAEAGDASEKPQQPAATHCVAAQGLPPHRGVWQLGIDRATGHKCWRLIGTIKPSARKASGAKSSGAKSSGAKSSPARSASAWSPRLTASRASPLPAPAVETHPSAPSEVPTGSVAKPSETLEINLGQAPVSAAAGVTGKPGEVNQGGLSAFDLRDAWTADRSLIENATALIATVTDPLKIPRGTMREDAGAATPVRSRAATFLIAFISVLATILALDALVVGMLKLLRSRRRRERPPRSHDAHDV
jgi:hypothetical protein